MFKAILFSGSVKQTPHSGLKYGVKVVDFEPEKGLGHLPGCALRDDVSRPTEPLS